MHKAQALPKEEFKREVERHLTGKETEPWGIIYFKLYKSQLPVVEKALETVGLMMGTEESRGYCLEMICADFLAGANVKEGWAVKRKMQQPRQKLPRLKLNPKKNSLYFADECANEKRAMSKLRHDERLARASSRAAEQARGRC